ncbi:MAG: cysteine desulfurase [Parcubacteria group bacterium]|nr:cysteine desulfurase [Parcubacteria group bacterium]
MFQARQRVYLDYAAAAPLDRAVFSAMRPYFSEEFANPSSIHSSGHNAKKAVAAARQKIAGVLGCNPDEVVFTSGGTESNNLALAGVAEAHGCKGHIITSPIEHASVLEVVGRLKMRGVSATIVGVDAYGRVNPQDVLAAIRDDTFLVSIMYANNEIGTIQDIATIGNLVQKKGILMHTDAVQAPGLLPLAANKLHIDLMSLSAHKFYGPKGAGIVYVKRGTHVSPQMQGGGHERGLRSGTENVPGIVGAAIALERAESHREKEAARLSKLRNWLIKEVMSRIPDTLLTGHPSERLPNSASFCFPGISGEHLVLRLSERGFWCSSGSACSEGSLDPSHVLFACGLDKNAAQGSLRITLGASTRLGHLKRLVPVLSEEIRKLR